MTTPARQTHRPIATIAVAVPLAMLAGSMPARAASPIAKELAAIETRLKRCEDKDSSTAGLKQCSYDAMASADRILNKVYKDVVASLKKKPSDDQEAKDNKDKLNRLLASEVAWIKFRDSDCELQGTSMLGGTGEGLVIAGCQYTMTAKRAKDLDDLFNSPN